MRKRLFALLLVAVMGLAACQPEGISDEAYFSKVNELEPVVMLSNVSLPFYLVSYDSPESIESLEGFIEEQRVLWQVYLDLAYYGKTFASSHFMLREYAEEKMAWLDRLEDSLGKDIEEVGRVVGELEAQMQIFQALDDEFKRNEEASDFTVNHLGEVVTKDSIQEATDEELKVDPRYLALKEQVKAFDEAILVFINEEAENQLVLTYRVPADTPDKGIELLQQVVNHINSLDGVEQSYYHLRGDFIVNVSFN